MNRLESMLQTTGQEMAQVQAEILSLEISKVIKPIQEEQVLQTQQLKTLNLELMTRMGDVFSERVTGELSRRLDTVAGVLQDIRGDRDQANQAVLQTMIEKFKESISGSAGTELKELASVLGNLNISLEGTLRNMEAGQEFLSHTLEGLRDTIGATIDDSVRNFHSEIRSVIGEVLSQIQSAGIALSDQMESSGKSTLSLLNRSVVTFEANIHKFNEAMETTNKVMDNSKDTLALVDSTTRQITLLQENFKTLTHPLEDLCKSLMESNAMSRQTSGQLRTLTDTLMTSLRSGTKLQDKLGQLWDQYPGRFEKVDQNLLNVFNAIEYGVQNYMVKVQHYMTEMDNHMGSSIELLTGAVSEINDTISHSTRLFEALNQSLGKASENPDSPA